MKYKHLFFDLDHTLWDFERNSAETLLEIFQKFELNNSGIASVDVFIESFLKINTKLWHDFDLGNIEHSHIRENRFPMVFEALEIPCPKNHLAFGEMYLKTLPTKSHLLNGAHEVLNYVTKKGYQLHIITNGFNDIQERKIISAGINHYFKEVVTFENANAKKPDPKIFQHALKKTQANVVESLMIGDNWLADILGAKKVGMDTVYYNPASLSFDLLPTYDIKLLHELITIL